MIKIGNKYYRAISSTSIECNGCAFNSVRGCMISDIKSSCTIPANVIYEACNEDEEIVGYTHADFRKAIKILEHKRDNSKNQQRRLLSNALKNIETWQEQNSEL